MVLSAALPSPDKRLTEGVCPVSLMSVVNDMIHALTGKGVRARAAAIRTARQCTHRTGHSVPWRAAFFIVRLAPLEG